MIEFIFELLFDLSDSGLGSDKFSAETRITFGVIAVIFYIAIVAGFIVMGYFSLENSVILAIFLFLLAIIFIYLTYKRIMLIKELKKY